MRTELPTTNQFYCAIAQIENCAKLGLCAEFQAQLMPIGLGRLKNILKFFCFTPRLVLRCYVIVENVMASVAKWLRQWFVVPPFVGSIPIIRPFDFIVQN
jgi:hypothetical protein